MLPWSVRLVGVLVIALLGLLGFEAAAAVGERSGVASSLWWLPCSLGVLVWVGWYIVRRLPLAWGVVLTALLYGATCLAAFPLKYFLAGGPLAWPAEVDVLFVLTALVIQLLLGAVGGLAGGLVARRRRRQRRREEALAVVASSRTTVLDPEGGPVTPRGLPRRGGSR